MSSISPNNPAVLAGVRELVFGPCHPGHLELSISRNLAVLAGHLELWIRRRNVLAAHGEPKRDPYRRAAMVSTLVAVRSADDPEPLIAVGRVVVQITNERRGSNGFGFDPVMYLPEFGKTFAELPPEVKNAHSHRGRAAQAMLALMRERWLDNAAP